MIIKDNIHYICTFDDLILFLLLNLNRTFVFLCPSFFVSHCTPKYLDVGEEFKELVCIKIDEGSTTFTQFSQVRIKGIDLNFFNDYIL